MSSFTVIIACHTIVAVVGVGLIGSIPIVAALARRSSVPMAVKAAFLEPLFLYTRWSLVAVVLTGALLEYSANGAFHSSGWFRASFGLTILVGIAHARARSALRKGLLAGADGEAILRRIERWGWTMCGAVALIAVLMTVKPF